MSRIDALGSAAKQIVNASTGYDQWQRWSFFDRSRKLLIPGKEADCSSSVGAAIALAGYNVNLTDPFYTGTLRQRLEAIGWRSERFRSLSQCKPGAVMLNSTHHTELCVSANQMFSASIDERGKAAGGRAGNQNGQETRIRSAYVYSHGWDWIIFPPEYYDGTATTPAPAPAPAATSSQTSVGCVDTSIIPVRVVQERLQALRFYKLDIDGIDGAGTKLAIKAYQDNQRYHPNLASDGKWGAWEEKHYQWVLGYQRAANGWDTLQRMGATKVDGDYGNYAAQFTLQLQKDNLRGAYQAAVTSVYGAGYTAVADGDPGRAMCLMLGVPPHPAV